MRNNFFRLREALKPLEVLVVQQAEHVRKLDAKLERLVAVVSKQQQLLQPRSQHSMMQIAIYIVVAGVVHAIFSWFLFRRSK